MARRPVLQTHYIILKKVFERYEDDGQGIFGLMQGLLTDKRDLLISHSAHNTSCTGYDDALKERLEIIFNEKKIKKLGLTIEDQRKMVLGLQENLKEILIDGVNIYGQTMNFSETINQALDAKGTLTPEEYLRDERHKIYLNLDGINPEELKKDSALWLVLEHVFKRDERDYVKLNGQKLSEYRKVVLEDGSQAFVEAIFMNAKYQTEAVKVLNNGKFDSRKFKEFNIETELNKSQLEEVAKKIGDMIDKIFSHMDLVSFGKGMKALPSVGTLYGTFIIAKAVEGKTEEEQKKIWAEFAASEIDEKK